MIVTTQPFADDGKRTELLGESSNDMGHVRLLRDIDGYRMEIDNGSVENGMVHVMVADSMFDYAMAYLRPEVRLWNGAFIYDSYPLCTGGA